MNHLKFFLRWIPGAAGAPQELHIEVKPPEGKRRGAVVPLQYAATDNYPVVVEEGSYVHYWVRTFSPSDRTKFTDSETCSFRAVAEHLAPLPASDLTASFVPAGPMGVDRLTGTELPDLPAPEPGPKVEAKPEVKLEIKIEPKAEAKIESKVEAKAEPKAEQPAGEAPPDSPDVIDPAPDAKAPAAKKAGGRGK